MTENPQKGDWVRVSYEAEVIDDSGYFSGQEVTELDESLGQVRGRKVEIIEKADHPRNDAPGTFRVATTGWVAVKVRPDRWYILDETPGYPIAWNDENAARWTRIDQVVIGLGGRRQIRKLTEPNGDVWFELYPGSGKYTWCGQMEATPAKAAAYRGLFREFTVDQIVSQMDSGGLFDLVHEFTADDR